MAQPSKNAEGEVIRDTQVGTEGDDVPDRLNQGREPRPYEGVGTHRFETRMSDEEIERGIGRDARHAAEVLHRQKSEQKGPVDLVPRPSEEEAKEKALGSPQASPQAPQQL